VDRTMFFYLGSLIRMQGFQAAANIAQDLDERPMPKGPLFPRWVPCFTRPLVGFDLVSDVGGAALVFKLLHSCAT
jgi:hypothetical protein